MGFIVQLPMYKQMIIFEGVVFKRIFSFRIYRIQKNVNIVDLRVTTGFRYFAVCPRHTAKPPGHTVKISPRVAHGEALTATTGTAKVERSEERRVGKEC